MSVLFQRDLGDTSTQLTPPRARVVGNVSVSVDSAMRHSAVWACLQLRADLISTMPLDVFRRIPSTGIQIEAPPTPFLSDPAGNGFGMDDWLYSSQIEMDRSGNTFGIIHARDAMGYPAVVEMVANAHVRIAGNGPMIKEFGILGRKYNPIEIWHERQYPIVGVPLGLSPIAYAAMSIGSYLSAQQFALDWFSNGAIPAGKLKNINKTINPAEAVIAKDRYKAAVANRDLFVHGSDWEYDMIAVAQNESQFLDTMRYGIEDIARFLGVPGDLIDAPAQSSAKITYANITQRHLQFLVLKLGPALMRRERALSGALPKPRYVKFNTDAFLRMDTQTREGLLASQVAGRLRTPSEAREIDNLPPFTDSQLAEFDRLFGKNPPPGTKTGATP